MNLEIWPFEIFHTLTVNNVQLFGEEAGGLEWEALEPRRENYLK
jgi:hypothetical protein